MKKKAKIKVNDIMSVQKLAPQLVFILRIKLGFLEIQNGCNHRCTLRNSFGPREIRARWRL